MGAQAPHVPVPLVARGHGGRDSHPHWPRFKVVYFLFFPFIYTTLWI